MVNISEEPANLGDMKAPLAFVCERGANWPEARDAFAAAYATTVHDIVRLEVRGAKFSSSLRAQLAWLCTGNALGFGDYFRRADYLAIIAEIEHLEGFRHKTSTRAPSRLHGPLAGFWHKHFFDGQSLFANLRREIEDNFDRLFHDVFRKRVEATTGNPLSGAILDEQLTNLLVDTMGPYAFADRRGANAPRVQSRLTGEWIVYAEHADVRHYLTLAWHAEEGNKLQSLIARLWAVGEEMPFVRDRLIRNGVSSELAAPHP